MTFAPKPPHSKGALNRAGRLLTTAQPNTKSYQDALKMVNEWRTCHAYPLNTFNATLRHKVKKYKGSIVAQRLKRLPTIVDKLGRFPDMKLSQMQDIGGIRAIVNTVKSVQQLQSEYKDPRRFTHKLKREHDYIVSPKPDGYRGVHLIFEYNNTLSRNGLAENYKGLNVELQIRTELQHAWATAVETTGTLIGESFKTGSGSKDWKEFFSLVASAFAIAESCPVVAKHSAMLPIQIYDEIRRLEKKLNVISRIMGLSKAANFIHKNDTASYYSIIVLNTVDDTITIYSFTENQLQEATVKYAELESKAEKGIDQVLVRAGDLKSLKAAYPNYFLDVKEFSEKLSVIIQDAK